MTLEELEKNFETEELVDVYSTEDYLDKKCNKKIRMYYSGWECDTSSWIMNDGTVFTTNHGHLCIMTPKDFNRYVTEMKNVASELNEISNFIKEC